MKKKELLVIIPAYNEETNIVRVLDDLEQPEIAEIADVLVMNDASSDATNWIVKARGHATHWSRMYLNWATEVLCSSDINMRSGEDIDM